MKYLFAFPLCLLLSLTASAQTRTDSICGTYTRHTWTGEGMTNIDLGNGNSAEIVGYTIATTDESLLLDKNHCAALTVLTQPGNFGSLLFNPGPVVYYGIWKMNGDTLSITFSKSAAPSFFTLYADTSGEYLPVKLSPLMQRDYLFEPGALTALTAGDLENYRFYKKELLSE